MMNDALKQVVESHWTALEAEQATGEHRLRVSQLPVTTNQGYLAAAVDHSGYRHVLIPIPSHRRVRSGLDGPVLRLRKRPLEDRESYQTYADLACLRTDLNDLFTALCVDILSAVEKMPKYPLKALYKVLDRWKALFHSQSAPLGPEQIAGLFGELLVLNRLLQHDSSAHRLWLGPEGHRHDFTAGKVAIEVKTSVTGKGRKPRIHGLDQLDAPQGGKLFLAWFRLEPSSTGSTGSRFLDLLEQVVNSCDDESALCELLAKAGYRPIDAERYRERRFTVVEERWYEVTPDFPSLTTRTLVAANVPVSVLDVEYTIDLSGDTPVNMVPEKVSEIIDCLIQESV